MQAPRSRADLASPTSSSSDARTYWTLIHVEQLRAREPKPNIETPIAVTDYSLVNWSPYVRYTMKL